MLSLYIELQGISSSLFTELIETTADLIYVPFDVLRDLARCRLSYLSTGCIDKAVKSFSTDTQSG